MRTLLYAIVATLTLAACSTPRVGDAPAPTSSRSSGAEGVDAAAQAMSNEPDASQPAPAAGQLAVVALERRAAPTPPPRVALRAPAPNAVLRENRLEVRLEVERWRNVSDPADLRHVCVALDGEACRRVDDPSRPVVFENLREGAHALRAWAAWESHEAVVAPGALAQVFFHVGAPVRDGGVDSASPAILFVHPEGELTGEDARRVMVDYLLPNIAPNALGDNGYRVRLAVDGETLAERSTPGPLGITGLSRGVHTLTLTLLGRDGAPLDGPLQRAERRVIARPGP